VNLTVTVTTEDGAVIPNALVILREDTLGQPRGVKVFELELRTDEIGKATAAVPCNYLDVFVAHDGFAPAAQKFLERVSKIVPGVSAIPVSALKSGLGGARGSRSLIFETSSNQKRRTHVLSSFKDILDHEDDRGVSHRSSGCLGEPQSHEIQVT